MLRGRQVAGAPGSLLTPEVSACEATAELGDLGLDASEPRFGRDASLAFGVEPSLGVDPVAFV